MKILVALARFATVTLALAGAAGVHAQTGPGQAYPPSRSG
jgi:hypothetical protein